MEVRYLFPVCAIAMSYNLATVLVFCTIFHLTYICVYKYLLCISENLSFFAFFCIMYHLLLYRLGRQWSHGPAPNLLIDDIIDSPYCKMFFKYLPYMLSVYVFNRVKYQSLSAHYIWRCAYVHRKKCPVNISNCAPFSCLKDHPLGRRKKGWSKLHNDYWLDASYCLAEKNRFKQVSLSAKSKINYKICILYFLYIGSSVIF